MKNNKDFRGSTSMASRPDDLMKRSTRLEPMRKSGKDRHMFFSTIDEDDDLLLTGIGKRESVLDYYDDADPDNEELDDQDELDDDDFEGDFGQQAGEDEEEFDEDFLQEHVDGDDEDEVQYIDGKVYYSDDQDRPLSGNESERAFEFYEESVEDDDEDSVDKYERYDQND